MAEEIERIAVLEAEVNALKDGQKAIMDKLDVISAELTKYRGFIGAITLIGGGIMALMSVGKDWLLAHLK